MTEPLAYLKGEFVPASQCVLPVYDLGIDGINDGFDRNGHRVPIAARADIRQGWAAVDDGYLFLRLDFEGLMSFPAEAEYLVYIDRDLNPESGYTNGPSMVGAEYVFINSLLYRYPGTGGDWGEWELIPGGVSAVGRDDASQMFGDSLEIQIAVRTVVC